MIENALNFLANKYNGETAIIKLAYWRIQRGNGNLLCYTLHKGGHPRLWSTIKDTLQPTNINLCEGGVLSFLWNYFNIKVQFCLFFQNEDDYHWHVNEIKKSHAVSKSIITHVYTTE